MLCDFEKNSQIKKEGKRQTPRNFYLFLFLSFFFSFSHLYKKKKKNDWSKEVGKDRLN